MDLDLKPQKSVFSDRGQTLVCMEYVRFYLKNMVGGLKDGQSGYSNHTIFSVRPNVS